MRKIHFVSLYVGALALLSSSLYSCVGIEKRIPVGHARADAQSSRWEEERRRSENEARQRREEEERRRREEERRRREEEERRRREEERRRREEEERRRREEDRLRLHRQANSQVNYGASTMLSMIMAEIHPKTGKDPSYTFLSAVHIDETQYAYSVKVSLSWRGRADRLLAPYKICEIEGQLDVYMPTQGRAKSFAIFTPSSYNERLRTTLLEGQTIREQYEVEL